MIKLSQNGEDFLIEERCVCGSSKLRFSLVYFAVVCDECYLRTSACDSNRYACIMWNKQMKILKRRSG